MCALFCIVMLVMGFANTEPTMFVAAGLFAIGAEIASHNKKEEN